MWRDMVKEFRKRFNVNLRYREMFDERSYIQLDFGMSEEFQYVQKEGDVNLN